MICLSLLLLLAPSQAVVDTFEAEALEASWSSKDSSLTLNKNPGFVHDGSGSLEWTAKASRAFVATTAIPSDWKDVSAISFWIFSNEEATRTLEIELAPLKGNEVFWRKAVVTPRTWQLIRIPLYQFRSKGVPSWSDLGVLRFKVREESASFYIDNIDLEKHSEARVPWIEPLDSLSKHCFPLSTNVLTHATKNFRIISDAPVDEKIVGEKLEEFLKLFQSKMGLKEEDLPYPATLVINRERPQYLAAAANTAREIYAAELDVKTISSDGYSFEQYSYCFFSPKYGNLRPTFYHEVCHQLVTRTFKLHGPQGATWLEEGICYYMQNEFLPQPDLGKQVLDFLDNPRRLDFSKFNLSLRPSGPINVQVMTLACFLVEGPHKEHLKEMMEAMAPQVNLAVAVEKVLHMPLSDFESEWESWCRTHYQIPAP